MAQEKFVGKFKLHSSENFDEYMKKIGVGFALRKLAATVKNVVELSIDGDTWTYKSSSTVRTTELKFTLGTETERNTEDSRVVKELFTFEDGKLIQSQTPIKEGEKATRIVREIDDDGNLVTYITCEDVTCKRIYVREA